MSKGGPPESSSHGAFALPVSLFDDIDLEADTDTGRISLPPLSRRPTPATAGAMLTVMSGVQAGRVFVLNQAEMLLGRSRDAQMHIDDTGISRRHARLLRTESGDYRVEDLGSTNGIYLNGVRVTSAELREGDRLQAGPTLLLRFSRPDELEEDLAQRLYEASTRDGLTGLYNRKYFTTRIESEIAFAERHGTPLGLIIFDIDHFKRINDEHGHPAGDAVLRRVASRVDRSIRREDVLARWGGEEFALLLRGLDHRSLAAFGERIRRGVEALEVVLGDAHLQVTISVGVASFDELDARGLLEEATASGDGPISSPSKGQSALQSLVGLADARLYGGKNAGRNRVVAG